MQISDTELLGMVSAGLWPFMRIGAFMTSAPIFGNRPVLVRVRIGLALGLTLVVAPGLDAMPAIDPLSFEAALVGAQQVLIGLTLGFAVRLVFIALELAGQQVAQLMGLGFAALIDPQNGIDVPVVSNFYIILGTLVFLSLDGHLIVIQVLSQSFATLPVSPVGLGRSALWSVSGEAGWIFAGALSMVLPAVAALLVVNAAFGVMSRAAPQLNIFVVGFPISMLFGFVVIMLTLPGVFDLLDGLFGQSIAVARGVVSGGP